MLAGVLVPALTRPFASVLEGLVALMLFLTALRIGPAAALRAMRGGAAPMLGLTVALQTGAPLGALAVMWPFGWQSTVPGIGVVLALAAAPILGAPAVALLARADPLPALRSMVVGTALLPLTALPVFWVLPVFGGAAQVLEGAARLLVLIGFAGGAGLALRAALPGLEGSRPAAALDGLTALAMTGLIMGLIAGLGPGLRADPVGVVVLLSGLCVLVFGSQLVTFALLRRGGAGGLAAPLAIGAGNRNLALFLPALPPELAAALMVFVGAYQVPMFLTPALLIRLYRTAAP